MENENKLNDRKYFDYVDSLNKMSKEQLVEYISDYWFNLKNEATNNDANPDTYTKSDEYARIKLTQVNKLKILADVMVDKNKKRELKKTVLEIMDSLCNRKGFDDWWFNLDDETQEEIEDDILMIIELRLGGKEKSEPPNPPLSRIIKEGSTSFCRRCGSTADIKKGRVICHNEECEKLKKYDNHFK